MESRPQPSVVPSNYPADEDQTSSTSMGIPRRTLSETTGNVRSSTLDTLHEDQDKVDGLPASKHLPVSSGLTASASSRSLASRHELRRTRSSASDKGIQPFTALQSTAYQQYRARQRRDAGDGDAVWPDHLEEAFQRGKWTSSAVSRRRRAPLTWRSAAGD